MTNLQKIEENLYLIGKKLIYAVGLITLGAGGAYLFLMGSIFMSLLGVLIIVGVSILAM